MNKYLVLKNTGRGTKSGRSAVVLPLTGAKGKTIHINGNIPELYHGMTINLELDKDNKKVLNYELEMTENNKKAIEKAGVKPEEYSAVLERHTLLKDEGTGWNKARLGLDEIYKVLPFSEADKVHKEMVNNAEEPTRLDALGKKIIDTARNRRKINYQIEEFLNYFDSVEQEGAYQHLMVSLKMLCLQASQYGFKNGTIWDNEMKEKEDYVRKNIERRKSLEYSLLTTKEIQKFLKKIDVNQYAEEQLNTLWCLETSLPCVITGGAGTGKTTVIKALIDCYSTSYSKKNILLVAPTGKASRRLSQKTGLKASTIHKALRKNPEDDFTFYSDKNPLPHRLIIVDESSMIDLSLMYDLLSALEPSSKVIFVGDHNQLYPVGYGEPFFEFLKTLDVYKLEMNHRQNENTDILREALKALRGEQPSTSRGVFVEEIPYRKIGQIINGLDDETQLISPFNGVNSQINTFLRKDKTNDIGFSVGDKVITLANTKEYSNGDIGYVTEITEKGVIFVDIEGKIIKITPAHRKDLSLAYAITIHKMQGSEANNVICFIPKNNSLITGRMLYTAFTRAKENLKIYYYTENTVTAS